MITSLIDLLRDCLPIHAAWSEAEMVSKSIGVTPPASALKRFMQVQAPGAAATVGPQPVPSIAPTGMWERISSNWGLREAVLTARLWSWKLAGINQIAEMNCRGRESGYRLFGVLPKVTFGLNGAPTVQLVTEQGQTLDVPLEKKYQLGQFFVQGGMIPKGKRTLWPLEARHDSGIVLVFVYEPKIDGSGKITMPLEPFAPSGAGKWTPVRDHEKTTFEELASGISDKDAWLEAFTGPFMHVPGDYAQTTAKTSEDKSTKVVRPRIVIAISMATCRERADFEPGGLVGMAKVFPNIMVISSMKLKTLEATVKIERTPKTTPLDAGDGTVTGTCCGALQDIGAILVTDANEIGSMSQKPFWGGTFAYVEPDANARFSGQKLKVVDSSKTGPRTYGGGKRFLVRRETGFFSKEYWSSLFGMRSYELKGVEKVARQGEWDNLHLAPALKLDLAKAVYTPPSYGEFGGFTTPIEDTVDPVACKTDKVWMAPFCAHDCFHTHWRWGSKESAEWTKGWNETGPYKVSGAPMVPLFQDVWLELAGASGYSYHVKSNYGTKHVPGTWDVVMHHGAAYAQSIADWVKFTGSQINLSLEQIYQFFDSKNKFLTLSHAPLMYWLFRFQVDGRGGKLFVTERIQFTQAEVDAARKT